MPDSPQASSRCCWPRPAHRRSRLQAHFPRRPPLPLRCRPLCRRRRPLPRSSHADRHGRALADAFPHGNAHTNASAHASQGAEYQPAPFRPSTWTYPLMAAATQGSRRVDLLSVDAEPTSAGRWPTMDRESVDYPFFVDVYLTECCRNAGPCLAWRRARSSPSRTGRGSMRGSGWRPAATR